MKSDLVILYHVFKSFILTNSLLIDFVAQFVVPNIESSSICLVFE